MSKKNLSRELNQEKIENSLGRLAISIAYMDQIIVRLNQAISRKPELTNLLEPALDQARNGSNSIRDAQNNINYIWKKGLENNWWD